MATACFCGLPAFISVLMFSETACLLLDLLSGIFSFLKGEGLDLVSVKGRAESQKIPYRNILERWLDSPRNGWGTQKRRAYLAYPLD